MTQECSVLADCTKEFIDKHYGLNSIGDPASTEAEIEELAIISPPEQVWYAAALYTNLPKWADITPQYAISNYRADFLVDPIGYFVNIGFIQISAQQLADLQAKMKRFVIEVDGFKWHDKTPEQAENDKRRDREMNQAGFIVYRYAAREILRDPIKCVNEIHSLVIDELRVASKYIHLTVGAA